MIPPFTGTNYKGNLKCTYGKNYTYADVSLELLLVITFLFILLIL